MFSCCVSPPCTIYRKLHFCQQLLTHDQQCMPSLNPCPRAYNLEYRTQLLKMQQKVTEYLIVVLLPLVCFLWKFPFLHLNVHTAIYHGNLVKLCNFIVTNGERKLCILGVAKHNNERKKKDDEEEGVGTKKQHHCVRGLLFWFKPTVSRIIYSGVEIISCNITKLKWLDWKTACHWKMASEKIATSAKCDFFTPFFLCCCNVWTDASGWRQQRHNKRSVGFNHALKKWKQQFNCKDGE